MVDLRGTTDHHEKNFDDSIDQTVIDLYGDFDLAADQLEVLHPGVHVPRFQLNLHKVVRDGVLMGSISASNRGANT